MNLQVGIPGQPRLLIPQPTLSLNTTPQMQKNSLAFSFLMRSQLEVQKMIQFALFHLSGELSVSLKIVQLQSILTESQLLNGILQLQHSAPLKRTLLPAFKEIQVLCKMIQAQPRNGSTNTTALEHHQTSSAVLGNPTGWVDFPKDTQDSVVQSQLMVRSLMSLLMQVTLHLTNQPISHPGPSRDLSLSLLAQLLLSLSPLHSEAQRYYIFGRVTLFMGLINLNHTSFTHNTLHF